MPAIRQRAFRSALLGLCAGLAAAPAAAAPESYKIDPVHSMVVFKVGHLGVSQNYGRFNDVTGTFQYDPENPAQSSFTVSVKPESVDTGDAKRDQHLKSPDFFNVKEFPAITFKSTSIKKKDDDTLQATGELSLHGVKKELTIAIDHLGAGKDPWGGYRRGFGTSFKVKRSDFGMGNMLDAAGDDVELLINIEGTRQ